MSLKYYGKEIQKHSTKISGSTLTVDLGADTGSTAIFTVSYTHLTLPTNREV